MLATALAVCCDDMDMLRTYLDMLESQNDHKRTLEAICKFCGVRVPKYISKRMREHSLATEHVS